MAAISASTSHSLPPQGAHITADPTRLPGVLLERILFMADNTKAAASCRAFARQTDNAVRDGWRGVSTDLIGMPNPKSVNDLAALYRAHLERFTAAQDAVLASKAKEQYRAGFHHTHFQVLRQVESDANLMRIWPKIREAVRLPNTQMTSIEIKAWLKANAERLATIDRLDLSGLHLTMIPEEFATLPLRGLVTLILSNNSIKTIPSNFGIHWENLKALEISHNQIQELPKAFGVQWKKLSNLFLNLNKLLQLPDDFGIQWEDLSYLNLQYNQLQKLPEAFGAPWKKFRMLPLNGNKLQHLPKNFALTWPNLYWLFLADNQLKKLPDNFLCHCKQLDCVTLEYNQIQEIPRNFDACLATTPIDKLLKGNPVVDHPPKTPNAPRSPTIMHIASTAALSLIASNIIGTKLAVAGCAVYLAHKYAKNLTPALLARPLLLCSLVSQKLLGKCRLPAMRI
jgi:Leucine-rich repeat (LRR) protein